MHPILAGEPIGNEATGAPSADSGPAPPYHPDERRRRVATRANGLRALAVGTAVLTTAVVAADLRALHRRANSLGPTTEFAIVTRDLPLGTRISGADVRVVSRPIRTVATDALRSPAAAVGRTLAVPLLAGDVVRARALTANNGSGLAGLVPPGHRAVRVRPGDGARPPAGATVDVLTVPDTAYGGSASPALTVAVGATVLAARGEADGEPSVTLLVTSAEAPVVIAAALAGRVGLALAPPPAVEAVGEAPPPGR